MDYLLKPLSFEELSKAIEKVRRRMTPEVPVKAEIYVKSSGCVYRLFIDDILYIKGLAEYVQIYLRGMNTPITTFDSIKRFERDLQSYSFMRVHKSYLINLGAVDTANRAYLLVHDFAHQPWRLVRELL